MSAGQADGWGRCGWAEGGSEGEVEEEGAVGGRRVVGSSGWVAEGFEWDGEGRIDEGGREGGGCEWVGLISGGFWSIQCLYEKSLRRHSTALLLLGKSQLKS